MKCNLTKQKLCTLSRRTPVIHLMFQNSKSPDHLLRFCNGSVDYRAFGNISVIV
jgi:hypothetical protein